MILLDTHTLIWLDQDQPDLGPSSRQRADEALRDNHLAVSAISFWEITMLAARGRIVMEIPISQWRRDLLASGLVEFPVDGSIGIAATELDDFHGDPADRIIVATARLNGAALITADQKILKWPGKLNRVDARS